MLLQHGQHQKWRCAADERYTRQIAPLLRRRSTVLKNCLTGSCKVQCMLRLLQGTLVRGQWHQTQGARLQWYRCSVKR